jgi:hypothetical protein
VNQNEAEKIAHTEALFREVNERIAETAGRLDVRETNFVCECADPACAHRVGTTLAEYEHVREQGERFLLVPGHEDDRVEAVVEVVDDHAVVEKRHPDVRRLVRALDPRRSAA